MIVDDFEAIAQALKRISQEESNAEKQAASQSPEPDDDFEALKCFYEALCDPFYY